MIQAIPRIYISAAHKSSGKTTLSIGLCAALYAQGLKVQPFKKGPDYIDPLWLTQASGGRACYNLDFNTMSHNEILGTLGQYAEDANISIIEGNKGLFDGVALDGSDSNAAVAKLTQSPVILVIDTRGVTRGVAPLLMGYQQFDADINIAGVIFNLSSGGRHESKLRAVTEEYTDIPVLGVVKKNTLLEVDERHLGLKPSNEGQGASQKIADIARVVAESVDLSRVIDIAKQAPVHELKNSRESVRITNTLATNILATNQQSRIRLGICEDSAFGFYYASDKLALEQAGADLIKINTLEDQYLPENLDGLFIGGGFPETHMQTLSSNKSMRESIHNAIEAGLPTYAECGGLMYLSQNIQWNGKSAPMVGIIPADAVMHKKPQGRGYVKLEETADMPWLGKTENFQNKQDFDDKRFDLNDADVKGVNTKNADNKGNEIINAHEFHYSALSCSELTAQDSAQKSSEKDLELKGKFAYKVHRGVGINGEYDGWVYKNLLANYSHMRDTDSYHWAQRFIETIRHHKCSYSTKP